MGDIWGYGRVFLWGTAFFALTGVAQGFVSFVDLLPLHFLQGVDGAILNASGLAWLAVAASEGRRAACFGFSSASIFAVSRAIPNVPQHGMIPGPTSALC